MARGYSTDLRMRVVALVENGESAREAARQLEVGGIVCDPLGGPVVQDGERHGEARNGSLPLAAGSPPAVVARSRGGRTRPDP